MEWTVVTVIIALIGLGAAVIKPIISLTNTITKLTLIVDALQKDMESLTNRNSASHERLWKKSSDHDMILDNHDKRITVIENKK